MLRVLPPDQTCLATNQQVVVNSEKFLQKLKSSSAFCNKKCTCLRALLAQGPPRKTCLVTTDVTPVVYHFHGQTGRSTVWANGTQTSGHLKFRPGLNRVYFTL